MFPAYCWLSLALDLTQMVLCVRKHLRATHFTLLNNFCFNNTTQKSSPGGCPCSQPTTGCLWPWAWPRWSWMSRNMWKLPSFKYWTTFVPTTLPKTHFLGMPGIRSSRNLSASPMLIRAGNPDLLLSRIDPGVKTFLLVPHTWCYIAWAPQLTITIAEFNIDTYHNWPYWDWYHKVSWYWVLYWDFRRDQKRDWKMNTDTETGPFFKRHDFAFLAILSY